MLQNVFYLGPECIKIEVEWGFVTDFTNNVAEVDGRQGTIAPTPTTFCPVEKVSFLLNIF